mgnify:CR=1 FL=1
MLTSRASLRQFSSLGDIGVVMCQGTGKPGVKNWHKVAARIVM